ncbi:DUF397 domain-containing protein [Bailinhaonella thermotolerans]|uniref:DUF397 domain-containing protein n=1 Tax=Bailinhaonella thermotolerans TaxID=1070861 RepID=UPI00192A33FA|nr:DUF397 domain-containing protein [Bailinhaonella thermotolerans]
MLTHDWLTASDVGTGCLQARLDEHGRVLVRNTTGGPSVVATAPEWRVFVREVKTGAFDLPS